jgi:hypothetical protein
VRLRSTSPLTFNGIRDMAKLALAYSGTSSHGLALGVELEQPLKRRSCIQISQRIGSAANPGGRADGNRKQRGSRRSLPSTLLRHDVALNMKLFLSKLEVKPPVPPGEPRGLNKERPRQCTEARAGVRGRNREGSAPLAATSRAMAR